LSVRFEMKFGKSSNALLVSLLVACGCSRNATDTKVDCSGWWHFAPNGFGGSWVSTPEPIPDSIFRLNQDGTLVSQGFFGHGRWEKLSDGRLRLSIVPQRTLARYNYLGNRAFSSDDPIFLEVAEGNLRLNVHPSKKGHPRWITFERYSPTASEISTGLPHRPEVADLLPKISTAEETFFTAIALGDADKVEKLIKAGQDPNGPKDAVSRFAGVNMTTLILAISSNRVGVARVLLKAGVNPNAATDGGLTPLMVAARRGSVDGVQLLLESGADANLKDTNGDSALDFARNSRHSDVVGLLTNQ